MVGIVETVPLVLDEYGVYRVGGTRVTLDTIIRDFEEGSTPEQIVQDYKNVQLSDVYQIIGYYLKHRTDIAEYLCRREREQEELLAAHPEWSPAGLRERLLARRKK
jgi:uncharacterized protein (DUF433 family)